MSKFSVVRKFATCFFFGGGDYSNKFEHVFLLQYATHEEVPNIDRGRNVVVSHLAGFFIMQLHFINVLIQLLINSVNI